MTDVERRLFVVMNGLPDALSPVLFAAMQAGALVAVFVCGLFALFARRPRLAGLIVLAGGSAWVLAKFVKRVVERGRPVDYLPDVVIRGAEQMGQGFPSGHAAVAAAMATVVTPYLSTRGRVVVWLIVALVALARVYTGAHLPYDVGRRRVRGLDHRLGDLSRDRRMGGPEAAGRQGRDSLAAGRVR